MENAKLTDCFIFLRILCELNSGKKCWIYTTEPRDLHFKCHLQWWFMRDEACSPRSYETTQPRLHMPWIRIQMVMISHYYQDQI